MRALALRIPSLLLLGGLVAGASPDASAGDPAEGLSAVDWAGIRAAREASLHAVRPFEGGHRARNPGQRWRLGFDGRGFEVEPEAGGWTWGLELVRWGFPGLERAVTLPIRSRAMGGRVVRAWGASLDEWYVNDRRGLEHGFTVHDRPAGGGEGELTFVLAVRGELRAAVDGDGRGVRFLDDAGATVLTYAGLFVLDADGNELEAGFEPTGDRLRLSIDERGARYPLTIDPVAQQAYLKSPSLSTADEFGTVVAASGDTVVVGAPFEDSTATGIDGDDTNNLAPNAGAAYVFVRNAGIWSQQAYLKASNTEAGDQFGVSVDVSDDTVVVGAIGEDSNAGGVNGDQNDNTAGGSGAAYVFVRSGTTWSQQAYLKASNTEANDQFGFRAAVTGDTVVVTANGEDSAATGIGGNQSDNSALSAGAAYVFTRTGTTWSQQAYIKASNPDANDQFGFRATVTGDTVVVTANGEDSAATGIGGNQSDNTAANAGAAYVFVRSGTLWSQQVYLKASNAEAGDFFGFSVAIAGDTLAVGSPLERSSATGVGGNQSDNSLSNAGAAYVFVRSGTTWSQQAYVKASNTGMDDAFGIAVASSGNVVVVGTQREDSGANGINGDQSDNSALDAGAAYVFVRSATTWSQDSYLKASNSDADDRFGVSLGLSGDLLVVGAPHEDSSATGVNGDQNNNGSQEAGAAYVFCVAPTELLAYCTGKTTSQGCVPFMSAVGSPSLSATDPFTLRGNDVTPGNGGILIYGVKKASLDFHGGKLCVKAPIRTAGKVAKTKAASLCTTVTSTGRLTTNFNNRIQGGLDPLLTCGQKVFAQWQQRDTGNTIGGFADNATDGIRFTIGP